MNTEISKINFRMHSEYGNIRNIQKKATIFTQCKSYGCIIYEIKGNTVAKPWSSHLTEDPQS